jgi:hypothetical protein
MITTLINDYFKHLYETRPEVRLHKQPELNLSFPGRPPGPLAHGRVEDAMTGSFPYGSITKYEGEPWTEFSFDIYDCCLGNWGASPTVVVAINKDNRVLWLDDHTDDRDFSIFARQEQLFNWLPQRKEELLDVLLRTKLHYIGGGSLSIARHQSDIPEVSTQVNLNKKQREALNTIKEPLLAELEGGSYSLKFYVWAGVHGRIIEIRCILSEKEFHFEGTDLAGGVGCRLDVIR